jgi:F0F1-type ATP synthase membrane subunit c/vacuolar-type H+-ATPase subunit K
MKFRTAFGFIFTVICFFVFSSHAFSQDDPTFAVSKIISDTETVSGDIVSYNAKGEIVRTSISFDTLMYGIAAKTGTFIYYPTEEGTPVIKSGTASVNVTTLAGDIQPGDYITSSPIAGKGQKTSIRDGWVVGVALTGLKEGEGNKITYESREISSGSVHVSLILGPAIEGSAGNLSRIIDQLAILFLKNIQTPTGTNSFFRFILAALVAIAAIAIGFGSFGKNVSRGIEAIGRNPLAKRQIQAMILLNVFLIGLISLAGIILALAIIRY